MFNRTLDTCVSRFAARPQPRQTLQAYLTLRTVHFSEMADADEPQTATTSGRQIPEGYKVLTEGKGSILQKGNDVFYNPAQASLAWSATRHQCSCCHIERRLGFAFCGTGSQSGHLNSSIKIFCQAKTA